MMRMPLRFFLLQLFRHSSLAYLWWYALVLAIEALVPGSVSPFFDLADGGLLAALDAVACVCFNTGVSSGRISRVFLVLFIFITYLIGGIFLWRFLGGMRIANVVLLGAFLCISLLCLAALFVRNRESDTLHSSNP